jgi:arylformamidase
MKHYKIIDISWPISPNTVEYKNKGALKFKEVKNVTVDGVHETHVTLDMHTGTHIDAPIHFDKNGRTVDQVSFDHLIGECKIFDLTCVEEKISASDLQKLDIHENDIILFKTKNSKFPAQFCHPEPCPEPCRRVDSGSIQKIIPSEFVQNKFEPNFIYLDKTSAQYLASKKIKTVGIDYLGIERAQPDHETHKIFFQADITIIEGLRLGDVSPGKYLLICLPVKFEGVEAALSRAVLLE